VLKVEKVEVTLDRIVLCRNGVTSSVPTSILIPEVVALCEGKRSSLNGQPIYVVAAGAIYNGKSLAAALMYFILG
jgi:NAD(P)H-dependent flavin oxidoreductase YrpB (nitropropane dioxygenase family)